LAVTSATLQLAAGTSHDACSCALRDYQPSQHGTGLRTGQDGWRDGITGSKVLGDEDPGFAISWKSWTR